MSENAESRAIRERSPDLINGIASEIHPILDIAYSKGLIGPEQQGNSFVPTPPSDKARRFVTTIESRVRTDRSAYTLFLSILNSRPELKHLAGMLEDKREELSRGDEPRAKIEKSEQTDSGAVVDPSHTLTEGSSQTAGGGDAVAGAANDLQPKLEPADPTLNIPAQESCENLIRLSQNAPTEASDGDEPSTHSSQPSLYSNGACGTGDADSIYFSAKTEPTAGVAIAGAPDDSPSLDTGADNQFPVQETQTSHEDVVRQKVRTDSRSRLMSGDLSSSDDALDDIEDAVRAGAAKMRRKLKERKRQVVARNEKIRELEEEVIARQYSEETLQAKLTEQSRENERLEYLIFEKTMESTRMKHKHFNEVKDLKTELTEKDKEVDSCKSQMAQMEKDNTAKIEDLETKIQALEDERVAMKSHNESLQKHHEIEITKLKHELELKKAEMTKVENERDSINNKLEKTELAYERKMLEHEKEINSLKNELILMKNCKMELECEKLKLELKLKDMKHEKQLAVHRENSVPKDVHEMELAAHRKTKDVHEMELAAQRKNSVTKDEHEKTVRELESRLSKEDLTKHDNVAELSEKFTKATI